jgi:hypothetical protein
MACFQPAVGDAGGRVDQHGELCTGMNCLCTPPIQEPGDDSPPEAGAGILSARTLSELQQAGYSSLRGTPHKRSEPLPWRTY